MLCKILVRVRQAGRCDVHSFWGAGSREAGAECNESNDDASAAMGWVELLNAGGMRWRRPVISPVRLRVRSLVEAQIASFRVLREHEFWHQNGVSGGL